MEKHAITFIKVEEKTHLSALKRHLL